MREDSLGNWVFSENRQKFSTGFIHDVENYKAVITWAVLTPFGREGEPARDKTKANNHIPGANMRDRVAGVADVVGHDPD